MKKRIVLVLLSVLLVSGIIGVLEISSTDADTNKPTSKYEKPSVQDITGLGDSPYEISSKASANAAEKQWYEYIAYNNQPVGESLVDSNTKLVFFDPYSYSNATIMNIQGTDDEWSSANTLSKTFTKSHSVALTKSDSTTETSSVTSTNPEYVNNSSVYSENPKQEQEKSFGNLWFRIINGPSSNSQDVSQTTSVGVEIKATETFDVGAGVLAKAGFSLEEALSSDTSTTETTIADRFSKSIGVSHTEGNTTTDTTTDSITRTFNATYFNQYGSPLQWKVVMYEVFLPIKVDMQKKVDGGWYTVDSAYCILKTMNGFSRAYIKDNKTYAEDWGTGEPVLWSEFENSFFTEEKLIEAYKNNLYPNN